MHQLSHYGCTLLITNIPWDMDLGVLRGEMEVHGPLLHWQAPPGPPHVYATFRKKEYAVAALQALREHRRLVVDYACVM